jgi:hydroxymethylbilane synthase
MPRILRVATRSSRLALTQTREFLEHLRSELPHDVEFKLIKTRSKGDRVRDRPLHRLGEKGVFVKAVDRLVLEGRADCAVHSAKDVPSEPDYPVTFAAVPPRRDPRECLVSRTGARLKELPSGSVVGTSSPRRRAQILLERPDLRVEPLRGNVDTRVRKVERGEFDATVLAKAGLERLGLEARISEVFEPEEFVPPAGQGALLVTCRPDDDRTRRLLEHGDDPRSRVEVEVEKEIVRRLGVGCAEPVGVYARARGSRVRVVLKLLDGEGTRARLLSERGHPEEVVERIVTRARGAWA